MKKVIKLGLLAGVLMLIVGFGLNFLFNAIFPWMQDAYMNEALFRPWSDPLMQIFIAYPVVVGLVLSWAWDNTKKLFKGKPCKRTLKFALAYWLVAGIPGSIVTYSSFKVPLLMVLTWNFSGFVYGLIGGCIFAKLNK